MLTRIRHVKRQSFRRGGNPGPGAGGEAREARKASEQGRDTKSEREVDGSQHHLMGSPSKVLARATCRRAGDGG